MQQTQEGIGFLRKKAKNFENWSGHKSNLPSLSLESHL